MNTRSVRLVPLIAAVSTALASGCGTAALTPPTPPPEEPDITVAALPAVDLAGLYVAQDQGLFARQGLHVIIRKIASSEAIIADQLEGQVGYPIGPVNQMRIQRVAQAMLQFGILSSRYAAEIERGALVASMVG